MRSSSVPVMTAARLPPLINGSREQLQSTTIALTRLCTHTHTHRHGNTFAFVCANVCTYTHTFRNICANYPLRRNRRIQNLKIKR